MAGADRIVLAAPVLANEALLAQVWRAAAAGAIVTDVGSTKGGIVARGRAARGAGGARCTSWAAIRWPAPRRPATPSRASTSSQGATVVVTPTESTDGGAAKSVGELWAALGARVVTLDPESHDRAVAAISHLPHVAAWALVEAVVAFEPGALQIAARGFKDTTRIAASDPDVWREILLANRAAVQASLVAYRRALDDLEALVGRRRPRRPHHLPRPRQSHARAPLMTHALTPPVLTRSINPLDSNAWRVLTRSIHPLNLRIWFALTRSIHPLGPKNCAGGVTTNPALTLAASRDIPPALEAVGGLGGASLAPPKL